MKTKLGMAICASVAVACVFSWPIYYLLVVDILFKNKGIPGIWLAISSIGLWPVLVPVATVVVLIVLVSFAIWYRGFVYPRTKTPSKAVFQLFVIASMYALALLSPWQVNPVQKYIVPSFWLFICVYLNFQLGSALVLPLLQKLAVNARVKKI